jgi:hypothetical protein
MYVFTVEQAYNTNIEIVIQTLNMPEAQTLNMPETQILDMPETQTLNMPAT